MKVIFYKPLWFLSMFIISLMPLFGQTYSSTGTDVCLSTISRNPTGNYPVHYMKTGQYSGRMLFNFTTDTYGMHFFKYIPINGYNVRDLTVVGNTVFFCGEDTTGIGFYGVWKRGTGIIPSHYFRIFKLYNTNTELVIDVQRIRVFCSGTDTNVLLIGKYCDETLPPIKKNALIHIKNNSTANLSYSNLGYFDDVEVLDNHVVTIMRKENFDHLHEPYYLHILNKTNFSLYDTLFNHFYSWIPQEAEGRILLQKVGGSEFVSVYRFGHDFYYNTYTISSNGVLQFYSYTKVRPPYTFTRISDIAFNASDSTLAVAYNLDTVGIVSLFNCTQFPSVSYIDSYKSDFQSPIDNDTLLSIAPLSSAGFWVTGIRNNKMALWRMLNGCENTVQCGTTVTESRMHSSVESPARIVIGLHQVSFDSFAGDYYFSEECVPLPPFPGGAGEKE